MGKIVLAAVILVAAGFAITPAAADCVSDIVEAQRIVDQMPPGRPKQIALNELRLAAEAARGGDEKLCLVHVGVCAQYAKTR